MSGSYFNRWEFLQAISQIENNLNETMKRLEVYLENYPNDYSAYCYYISVLIKLGEIDKAEKFLNYIEQKVDFNKKIYINDQRMIHLEQNMILERIKILSYQKKYVQLYDYLKDTFSKTQGVDLRHITFYARKQIGLIDVDRRDKNNYLFRQIVDYQYDDFIEHIIKRHLNNDNLYENNKVLFEKNFPLLKVIEEIRKYLPSSNKINGFYYDNIYFFKYDNCDRVGNRIVDYFKVVCFDDTSDIITMYPCIEGEYLPNYDLNYMIKKENKGRKLSQIDKFNLRYGKRN